MKPDFKSQAELASDNRERWTQLTELYRRLGDVKTTQDLTGTLWDIYTTSGNKIEDLKGFDREGVPEKWPFSGLGIFLDEIASREERETFFQILLPFIANLASKLQELSPREGLLLVARQNESLIPLNRKFIASLLASGFVCSLPPCQEESSTRTPNFGNFFSYFHRSECKSSQTFKLRCFLHYFERLAESDLDLPGNVIYSRQVVPESLLPSLDDWLHCNAGLCPVVVDHHNKIEDSGSGLLQVDFANCFIGGGVLGSGHTQEEIRFCLCPELVISMMFMEAMDDNEVVTIRGAERFSSYTGYGGTLQFAGDYRDTTQRDMFGNLETTVVAMDATSFKYLSREKQYERSLVLRELNKALVGFYCPETGCQLVDGIKDAADAQDTEATDASHIEPVKNHVKPIDGLDELGVSVIGQVFKDAWRDLEMSFDAPDEGDDLLTSLMKKSVEEVFGKTPEKVRIYTETVTNASLLPKCLQHQDSINESTSPLVPGTPPSSRDISGTQTPISAPGPASIISGAIPLTSTSFADTLSKSLLSCVSMSSSLANSIATVACTPLQIASVTMETFQKSPKDIGSPVKNGNKLISFLSQKVYDTDANPLTTKEIHYENVSEFAEDLTSIIGMQKSDWSRDGAKLHGPDSPTESDSPEDCDYNAEEESEARRRSLAELALNLFEDFASSLACTVLGSALGSIGGTSQLGCITEENEASEGGGDSDVEYCHDDSDSSSNQELQMGEFHWEETCDSALEQEYESISDEDSETQRGVTYSSEELRNGAVVVQDVTCGSEGLRDNAGVVQDVTCGSEGLHDNVGVVRDVTCGSEGSRDSFHDSESDSEPGDVHHDWNSFDIEREIEDKFFDLDLSDEEETTLVEPTVSDSSSITNLAAKLSVDVVHDGMTEAVSKMTAENKSLMDSTMADGQGSEIVSEKQESDGHGGENGPVNHVRPVLPVIQENEVDSYELSYEEPDNCSDNNSQCCGPKIMVTHAEGMTSSVLSDALQEATQHLVDNQSQSKELIDLSNVENELDSNNNEEEECLDGACNGVKECAKEGDAVNRMEGCSGTLTCDGTCNGVNECAEERDVVNRMEGCSAVKGTLTNGGAYNGVNECVVEVDVANRMEGCSAVKDTINDERTCNVKCANGGDLVNGFECSIEDAMSDDGCGEGVDKLNGTKECSAVQDTMNTDPSSTQNSKGPSKVSSPPSASSSLMASLLGFADVMSQHLIEGSTSLVNASERLSEGTPTACPVATGNWGCGVFKGDPELKAILQWMAASEVGCPTLVYHTFGDSRMPKFFEVQQTLRQRGWRVRDVMQVVSRYCETEKKRLSNDVSGNIDKASLFELLLQS